MGQRHGLTKHPIYTSWRAMKARCHYEAGETWADYGGRGIRVCDEWLSFLTFYAWAKENGWSPGLTIDRCPNVDGDYEPTNCRWTDAAGQVEFKRVPRVAKNAVLVTHDGRTMNLRQWSTETGIGYTTLVKRVAAGKSGGRLFATISKSKSHPRVS